MSFRVRIALLCAGALAVTLTVAGAGVYLSERAALRGQLDGLLQARAVQLTPATADILLGEHGLLPKQREQGAQPPPVANDDLGFADLELVTSDGAAASAAAGESIPVDRAAAAVAAGRQPAAFRTMTIGGTPMRMYIFQVSPGVAGEVVAPLTKLQASLRELARRFTAIAVGSLVLVVLLTVGVAWQALRPVAALTRAAENVIRTGDLGRRVPVAGRGRDEIGRMAGSVNAMLDALEQSVSAQRQLVADASHELGTPLTTLTVNLQLLDEPGGLTTNDAPELVRQARAQAEELAAMAGALVELARDSDTPTRRELVRLDLVAENAAGRARHTHGATVEVRLSPCVVQGDADQIERAIGNLLDNAVKWSPPEGTVTLTVADGEVVVADEGPGIAEVDLPFVFDRFYRSATARGKPGSGLGLAIVRQAAEAHGGTVSIGNSTRGAVARLRLPVADAERVMGPLPGTQADGCREALGDRPDVTVLVVAQHDDLRVGCREDRVLVGEPADQSVMVVLRSAEVYEPPVAIRAFFRVARDHRDRGPEHVPQRSGTDEPWTIAEQGNVPAGHVINRRVQASSGVRHRHVDERGGPVSGLVARGVRRGRRMVAAVTDIPHMQRGEHVSGEKGLIRDA